MAREMYQTAYHGDVDLRAHSFLITGGAGFIGSHIVEYLLTFGAGKVRVLDNLITGRYENIRPFEDHPNFEYVEGDIRDTAVCMKACRGIDYVSHQAALGSVPRSIKDPARTNAINVSGFLDVLMAANEHDVRRVVFASSSSVYGDAPQLPKLEENIGNPLSPYAVSKRTNELYAKVFQMTYGLEVIGLRYFNVFGPRQDPNGPYAAVIPIFIDRLNRGEAVSIDGDGEQTRDFTFVENAVQANIRALFTREDGATGEIYNVAYGENYSVNHLYRVIADALDTDQSANHREARVGDVRNSLADVSKARRFLGYDPLFSFNDGIPLTVDFYLGR